MHGNDPYIAAVVALLFITGLVVTYWAVRQRSVNHRNWDGALVGTRGEESVRTSARNKRA
jgi:hypothetical protein